MALKITPTITYLFNKSLELGRVPKDWLDAHIVPVFKKGTHIVPVFKKGNKNTPSNYLPVSLICILCQILEHIIQSSIIKHLDTHKILTDSQYDFRTKRSCETQLILTLEDILKTTSKGKQIDIALLDFSKAFNKVPRQRFNNRFNLFGIRDNTLNWISSFLHNVHN